jgi:hypothetical protein
LPALPLFEIAGVVVCFKQVASFIVNANHSITALRNENKISHRWRQRAWLAISLHNVKGGRMPGNQTEPPHNDTAYYYLADEHPFGLVQSHSLP